MDLNFYLTKKNLEYFDNYYQFIIYQVKFLYLFIFNIFFLFNF